MTLRIRVSRVHDGLHGWVWRWVTVPYQPGGWGWRYQLDRAADEARIYLKDHS